MAIESGLRHRSLRRRLVLGIVVTAGVAAFAEAVLLHVVWYGYENRLIDRVVSDELRRSVELYPREPALAYPNTDDLTLYVVSRDPAVPGDALPTHLEPLRHAAVEDGSGIVIHETTAGDGIEYHVGIARRGDRTFLLAYDAHGHAERRSALLWSVVAIAALLTFVASRLALHLVDRLLAGLSRLQGRIAESGVNGRFLDDDMDTEIAALASALDGQRVQVIAALRKERAFAAAASHELRTPLTRIATGAELLLAQPGMAAPVTARLRSIRESVDELQRLLDVLLQVARWQPGDSETRPMDPGGAPRPLGELVDGCVERLAGEARLLGTRVDVDVASRGRPVVHPAMLEIVLSNLLRNAIRHGRSAPVQVREQGGVLEVIDAGPGIDPAALDRVFDPFWRGSDTSSAESAGGLGLGLTIAERLCAAAGWTLSVASGEGRGTRATVRLDPGSTA